MILVHEVDYAPNFRKVIGELKVLISSVKFWIFAEILTRKYILKYYIFCKYIHVNPLATIL